MSVKFAPGGGLNPGKPVFLFEDKRLCSGYDVAADGRLLVTRDADDKGAGAEINVVLRWFQELKRELPK